MASAIRQIQHCGWHQYRDASLKYECRRCEGIQLLPSPVIFEYYCPKCKDSYNMEEAKKAEPCPYCTIKE